MDVINELIYRLEKARDNRALRPDEHRFRNNLKVRLLGISALQRSIWRQKSRVRGIKEGDACTKKFHLKASARRRKNYIQTIQHEGQLYTGQEDKLRLAWEFFHRLVGSPAERSNQLLFPQIGYTFSTHTMSQLEEDFSEEEVLEAINDTSPDKAPGPDGFMRLFYQRCW